MKDPKLAYVEDCPDEDDVDINTAIPPQSRKRVNFATKLSQSRESYSATDSGYQSGVGGRDVSQKNTYDRESNTSHRNEAKTSSKDSGRERFFWNRQPSKEDAKSYPTRQKQQVSSHEIETPSVRMRDPRFEEGEGNAQRIFSPCYCQQCQRVFFAQATAARPYFPNPQSHLQSSSCFPSMIPDLPADTKSAYIDRSNAMSTFETSKSLRPGREDIEIKPVSGSSSQLNSDIETKYPSYPQWFSPGIEYSPKGNFYSKSPVYPYLGHPVNYFSLPFYQLPLYAGSPGFPPPLSPEAVAQLYNHNPERLGHWWPPDWSFKWDLGESNHKHLSQINSELHAPGSRVAKGPKQRKSHNTQTHFSAPQATVPNSRQGTPENVHKEQKPSRTKNDTHKSHSHSSSYPFIQPKATASFVSTKDTRRQSISSKTKKGQVSIPKEEERSHRQKDHGEQNVQGSLLGDKSKPINTKKPPQKTTKRVNETRDRQFTSVTDHVGHKTSTHKSNKRNNSCRENEKKQNNTVDDKQHDGKPLPLTREALAKLNKEHGDDIDTKVQGICRANSSRSTIFNEDKVFMKNSGGTKRK